MSNVAFDMHQPDDDTSPSWNQVINASFEFYFSINDNTQILASLEVGSIGQILANL